VLASITAAVAPAVRRLTPHRSLGASLAAFAAGVDVLASITSTVAPAVRRDATAFGRISARLATSTGFVHVLASIPAAVTNAVRRDAARCCLGACLAAFTVGVDVLASITSAVANAVLRNAASSHCHGAFPAAFTVGVDVLASIASAVADTVFRLFALCCTCIPLALFAIYADVLTLGPSVRDATLALGSRCGRRCRGALPGRPMHGDYLFFFIFSAPVSRAQCTIARGRPSTPR